MRAGKLPKLSALLLAIFAESIYSLAVHAAETTQVETRFATKIVDSSSSIRTENSERNRIQFGNTRPRVLFITAKGCQRCKEELERLRKPGGEFESMKSIGWKIGEDDNNHIQIVDRDEIPPEFVQLLKIKEFPTVACVVDGEIVRSFKDGCTTPLDAWTFGWLIKGKNERPQAMIPEIARVESTGHYRLRGNHWTVEGDPNPPKQMVINHIRGPNHGHASGSYGNIDNWSYEELRSLHDDLHEMEGGTIGNFSSAGSHYQPLAANRSLDAFSGNRKVTGR